MSLQQPGQTDESYYKALDRQLTRYENTRGRDAGVRATAVQREMRDLWSRMSDSSKVAVKTWREGVAS